MRLLGLVAAVLAAQLLIGTATASAKPPPDNFYRKAQAVAAIETRCALNNDTLCRVRLRSVKSVGTRGDNRIYCGTAIPLSGKNKDKRQRYRAVVTYGKLPSARQVRTCRR